MPIHNSLGDQSLLDQLDKSVCITGSRASTVYGNQAAGDFTTAVCEAGHLVVSSGGYGIDTQVTRAALAAGGPQVIVLASGINHLYPSGNADLFGTVVSRGGLVLSLCEDDEVPNRARSLARAEWLAAHTARTLIIEAAIRSSSRYVASLAMSNSRPVGAVPGPISSATSHGSHQLIADGASIVHDQESLHRFLSQT